MDSVSSVGSQGARTAWKRFYTGDLQENPAFPGSFIRQGKGIQRWATGQMYDGQWVKDLPDGTGSLWESVEDWEAQPATKPLYQGQWEAGLRHGKGTLRWMQFRHGFNPKVSVDAFDGDASEPAYKIYKGDFARGQFSGHGWLSKESPGASAIPSDALALASVIRPEPHSMISFEGLFRCDAQIEMHTCRSVDFYNVLQCPDDAALEAYRQAGRELFMAESGRARYVDGSEFMGSFEAGRPQGQGTFVQWADDVWVEEEPLDAVGFKRSPLMEEDFHTARQNLSSEQKMPQWLFKYTGQWLSGCFHGAGELRRQTGLNYVGQFAEGLRHGQGTMQLSADARISYLGSFNKDAREGHGKLLYDGAVLYNGLWACNAFYTVADKPAWLHFAMRDDLRGQPTGYFYFGQLSPRGERHGLGSLYVETAREDPEFRQCIQDGIAFSEDPSSFHSLNHLVYHGQWQRNQEHGTGFQHLYGKGTYEGQFARGRRHGRGTFITDDRQMIYRSVPGERCNWDNDKMHGIAIVEDCEVMHSNLIFDNGSCIVQLDSPFPPLEPRSAELAAEMQLGGAVLKKVLSRVFHFPADVAKTNISGVQAQQPQQQTAEQSRQDLETRGAVPPGQESSSLRYVATANVAGLEDITISKCIGEEKCLEGLYFRCWQYDEGLQPGAANSVYRLVQASVERYLFREVQSGRWIISPGPPPPGPTAFTEQAGCIIVQDAAEDPSAISSPWQVLRTNRESGRLAPTLCRMVVRSVMGIQVTGVPAGSMLASGLFCRCSCELAGRPVYKSDQREQYLYWVTDDGAPDQGRRFLAASSLLAAIGHWVIAPRLDAKPGNSSCLAFIEDPAATPHQLHMSGSRHWQVAVQSLRNGGGDRSTEFEECSALRLVAQEWVDSDSEGKESMMGSESDQC